MGLDKACAPFGATEDGQAVSVLTLDNGVISCRVLTYGATLQSLRVPDREGTPVDVILGYDTLEEYEKNTEYFGATVGRFANRIARAAFSLNGTRYSLQANDGRNHLHGGPGGFSGRVWSVAGQSADSVTLSLHSPHGDGGYPGNLSAAVTYTLRDHALEIRYRAVCDAATPCSLTNHSYFNLAGHDSGSVLDQTLQLFAGCYTPSDAEYIPYGTIESVEGTPMDLRRPVTIGGQIHADFHQLVQAGGYDHNYVLDGATGIMHPAAAAYAPKTGIRLQVNTTQPGLQLYTANSLPDGQRGKGGCVYGRHHGFCLETQYFPDSPNQPAFPGVILEKGQTYEHTTEFVFDIDR